MAGKLSDKKKVPTSVQKWKTLAAEWRVLGAFKELGSQEKVKSASKFEFRHFLGLRVIYQISKTKSILPVKITNQFPPPIDAGLERLIGWNAYLDEIEKLSQRHTTLSNISEACVPMNLAALINVWQLQQHVLLGDGKAAEISKVSEVSPVSNRTRAKDTRRVLFQPSPTPGPRFGNPSLSDRTATLAIKDEDIFAEEIEEQITDKEEDDSDEETSGWESSDTDGFYTPARGS